LLCFNLFISESKTKNLEKSDLLENLQNRGLSFYIEIDDHGELKNNKFDQSDGIKKRQSINEEDLWKSHPQAMYKYMK
jgi:hypothetical protein